MAGLPAVLNGEVKAMVLNSASLQASRSVLIMLSTPSLCGGLHMVGVSRTS